MQTLTLPTTALLCAFCYGETSATREIHYVENPGTADEHGASVAICADPACYEAALEDISTVGDVIDPDDHVFPLTGVLPVIGPLRQLANGSGVTWAGTCTHQAPDSCPDCDGTRPWASATVVEVLPPCMLPRRDENAA
ncbi:MAG TPA: hypothetical protein VGN22_15955 [Pseudonocardia sp.]